MLTCPTCNITDLHVDFKSGNPWVETTEGPRRLCDDCAHPPRRTDCCLDARARVVYRKRLGWCVERPCALYGIRYCPWCGATLPA